MSAGRDNGAGICLGRLRGGLGVCRLHRGCRGDRLRGLITVTRLVASPIAGGRRRIAHRRLIGGTGRGGLVRCIRRGGERRGVPTCRRRDSGLAQWGLSGRWFGVERRILLGRRKFLGIGLRFGFLAPFILLAVVADLVRNELTGALENRSELCPQIGPLAVALGNDMAGPQQRLAEGRHLPIGIHKVGGASIEVLTARRGRQDLIGQRLQPSFAGGRGQRLLLWLEGQVKIFELLERIAALDLRGQLGRELALRVDRAQDRGLALIQQPQLGDSRLDVTDLLFIQPASLVLAIAGDEGDGVLVIQQPDDAFHLHGPKSQLTGDRRPIERNGRGHGKCLLKIQQRRHSTSAGQRPGSRPRRPDFAKRMAAATARLKARPRDRSCESFVRIARLRAAPGTHRATSQKSMTRSTQCQCGARCGIDALRGRALSCSITAAIIGWPALRPRGDSTDHKQRS